MSDPAGRQPAAAADPAGFRLGTDWDQDAIACGLFVVDREGVIVNVNAAAARMMGLPVSAARGRRIDESPSWFGAFFYEDGSPMAGDDLPITRVLGGGRAVSDLVFGAIVPGRPEPIWGLLSVNPLSDDGGSVVGAVATVTDISEQKRTEALLARTAAELHGVLHALPDLYFHLDKDGLVVDFHIGEGFDAHVEPDTLVGRRPAEFLPAEMRGGARKAYAEARLSGQPVVFEAVSEIEGDTVHHEFRYVALPEGDMVVIVRDVTVSRHAERALRVSEERYRTLFERSLVGLFLFDSDLIVTECNEAFTHQTGMPREFFDGLDLLSLHDQRIIPALRRALAGEFASYHGEYTPTVGGRGGRIVLYTQPVFGEGGHIVGGLGILAAIEAGEGAAVTERDGTGPPPRGSSPS